MSEIRTYVAIHCDVAPELDAQCGEDDFIWIDLGRTTIFIKPEHVDAWVDLLTKAKRSLQGVQDERSSESGT